ncbi:MAG: acyl--CoA ligase [Proteobacteria bacterium]|nr:acyl--CoA ligase [Pseudomonadota bacterium]
MKSSLKLLGFVIKSEISKRFPKLAARPSIEEIRAILSSPGLPFEIEQVEVNGRSIRSWKNAAPSMAALLEGTLEYGDMEFIVYQDERLSFAEHYRRAAAVAHQLIDRFDIEKGDRVAIAMRNYPEWSVAFWAAAAAGAVVVPLNAWWTSDELEYGLKDSGTRLIFADAQRLERLQQIDSELPLQHIISVRCETVPEGVTAIEMLWQGAGANLKLPAVSTGPEDDATLFYTSGTTGFPKGTLGTHRNFCSAALTMPYTGVQGILRSGSSLLDLLALKKKPRAALLTVPLFHVTGCHGIMLGILSNGGKLVMMHKWDPVVALQLIEQEHINIFSGVPSMVRQLLDVNETEQRDLSGVTNIGYGGAPAPPDLLRRIKAAMPAVGASNGWGTTETSAGIATNSRQDYADKPDSVGPPAPVCDVKVVNEDGEQLANGELGELWVRGPNVVKGYWHNPQATAASFTDGWFHTGDVGKIDAQGFIYIVDRLKDMIIRGGENIYCAEVEVALSGHPTVKLACVFGLPDEILGELVGAVVQVAPNDSVSEQELQQFVANSLAAYKVPTKIWIRNEPLPTGATGKVLKKELRAFYTKAEN